MNDHSTLIESLRDPSRYGHETGEIAVRETHISSIVLTGIYAYKIKKPVEFDFLDFTSVEQRRFYCEREVELNRRLCPDLYRSVVPITGSPEDPVLEGSGPVLDYAVKMVQFDEENLLSRRAENNKLRRETIEETVDILAEFHTNTEKISRNRAPSPLLLRKETRENFHALDDLTLSTQNQDRLETLRNWSKQEFEELATELGTRCEDGFVRNCHGDAHLGNMVLHQDDVKIFDCIEFNDEYRYIDVMNELAFLTMDLHHRNYPELARWAINRYTTRTGDHAGLKFLNYFRTYRAMVRAKVNHLDSNTSREETLHHIRTAYKFTEKLPRGILITHGFSGTGKTTQTDTIIRRHGAVRIRSDVERKRLAGIPFRAEPEEVQEDELYSTSMTERTYDELYQRCRTILESGFPVVVDATFLKRKYRRNFRRLAGRLEVPFGILEFDLSKEAVRRRLRNRNTKESISDAGIEVFEKQLSLVDPVQPEEAPFLSKVDKNGLGEKHHRTIRDFFGNKAFRPKKTENE